MRDKDGNIIPSSERSLSMEELAVYSEVDALQIEMGNIVAITGKSGLTLYDTERSNQHKDRYSSLAMANDFVQDIEVKTVAKYNRGSSVIGFATKF